MPHRSRPAACHALPAAAAAAVLALAACSDGPTTPAPLAPNAGLVAARGAASPGGIVVPGKPRPTMVTLTLHVGDQMSAGGDYGVPGTAVAFSSGGFPAKTVADNAPGDADPRVGYYSVQMVKANSFTATVTTMPEDLSADSASKTTSAYATPTHAPMGTLTLLRKPGLTVRLYHNNALTPGQTVRVTGPNGWSTVITDGSAADHDGLGNPGPNDGKVSLQLPGTGTYQVCAITSPQLYWAADCRPAWAIQYFMGYSVDLAYEQKWFVPKF